MRRVRETLIATGTADGHFAHSTLASARCSCSPMTPRATPSSPDWPWPTWRYRGRDPREATDRLTAAIAGLAPREAHARVISQAKLAGLTMATGGDPAQVVAIGTAAFDTIRSPRILDGLWELNRHAAAHQKVADVADLRHRIGTLVLAA
jgi:hypothetical protein